MNYVFMILCPIKWFIFDIKSSHPVAGYIFMNDSDPKSIGFTDNLCSICFILSWTVCFFSLKIKVNISPKHYPPAFNKGVNLNPQVQCNSSRRTFLYQVSWVFCQSWLQIWYDPGGFFHTSNLGLGRAGLLIEPVHAAYEAMPAQPHQISGRAGPNPLYRFVSISSSSRNMRMLPSISTNL